MTSPPARSSKLSVSGLLEVVTALATLATVMGFLGRRAWLLELTCHFRPHLAFTLGLLSVVWAMKRRWRIATLCGVAAAINAVLVLLLLRPDERLPFTIGPRLRLAVINVHTQNERNDLMLDFLRRADADVVLLMEVNERWMNALGSLRTNYPHLLAQPREDNFGIALFSRLPWTNGEVIELGEAEVPSIAATIQVGGQNVFLLGTHPLPPGSPENARLRNEQLREIAARVRGCALPAVVLGDLNCTPWSPYFADLLRDGRLRNTAQGHGLWGTWPAWLPVGRIPLDHGLVSASIGVISRQLGPPVGGDHLPLVLEVQIPTADTGARSP